MSCVTICNSKQTKGKIEWQIHCGAIKNRSCKKWLRQPKGASSFANRSSKLTQYFKEKMSWRCFEQVLKIRRKWQKEKDKGKRKRENTYLYCVVGCHVLQCGVKSNAWLKCDLSQVLVIALKLCQDFFWFKSISILMALEQCFPFFFLLFLGVLLSIKTKIWVW